MLFQSHSRSKLRTLAILKKLKTFLQRRICFLLKNESFQLWTFRELLRFQSHSTAILLALNIFKNVKIFFEKTIYLLKKNPKFRTFWEPYQFSRTPWQICYLWRFLKNWRFFLKDTSKFNKKPKILTLNVSRILAITVAFYGNFAGSSIFSKRQKIFFEKTIYLLKKNPKFRTFWESYQFSRTLWQICNL